MASNIAFNQGVIIKVPTIPIQMTHRRTHHFIRIIWLLAVIAICNAAQAVPPPITTATEVRSLSREQAQRGLPVKIAGTVVLQVGRGLVFNIHDGTECLAVHYFKAKDQGIWQGGTIDESTTEPGSYVEIEGITDPAGYVPVLVPTSIKRLGQRPIPPPKRVSIERLLSGVETSQLVEVEGIVQQAMPLISGFGMVMIVDGQVCDVKVQQEHGLDPAKLIDARIRISGCASVVFNLRSEAVGLRLFVQDQNRIQILRAPPSDPFQAPRVPLRGLLPFSRDSDRFHRRVTSGVVNFVQPGEFFFFQESGTGVRVDASGDGVRVGDLVEVAGFVNTSHGIASLTGAVSRTSGKSSALTPVRVTAESLLNPTVASMLEPVSDTDHYGALVRVEGVIRDNEWLEDARSVRLRIDSDGSQFDVRFPNNGMSEPVPWPVGSKVAVIGVCQPYFDFPADLSRFPITTGITLWSRHVSDVTVLKAPPWWTPARLNLALGGSLAVLAISLAWSALLRRRVNQQMCIISGKLRTEAVSGERNRMARDLHDTLEQMLAGVSLQLDDAEESIREDESAALHSIGRARRMLDFTRTEARRSVWELRSQVLEMHGLDTAISTMAEAYERTSGPLIEVTVTGTSFELTALESYNLLHMCQEALANAVKHSAATRISITLSYAESGVRLVIADDGRGFLPGMLDRADSPHFGVLGMRERAARINAELSITGTPGDGCRVSIGLVRKTPVNPTAP